MVNRCEFPTRPSQCMLWMPRLDICRLSHWGSSLFHKHSTLVSISSNSPLSFPWLQSELAVERSVEVKFGRYWGDMASGTLPASCGVVGIFVVVVWNSQFATPSFSVRWMKVLVVLHLEQNHCQDNYQNFYTFPHNLQQPNLLTTDIFSRSWLEFRLHTTVQGLPATKSSFFLFEDTTIYLLPPSK